MDVQLASGGIGSGALPLCGFWHALIANLTGRPTQVVIVLGPDTVSCGRVAQVGHVARHVASAVAPGHAPPGRMVLLTLFAAVRQELLAPPPTPAHRRQRAARVTARRAPAAASHLAP